jgi:electron transfer flavoprotein alpha subunit
MSKKILVLADIRRQKLRNVTWEMLSSAQRLAEGGEVAIALLGKDISGLSANLGEAGADRVYVVDADQLSAYTPGAYKKAFMACIQDFSPDVILLAHSAIGRDLAPVISARLGAGQASDVIGVAIEDGEIVFTRPIYAGKAFTNVKLTSSVIVATIRPNNLAVEGAPFGKAGAVQAVDVSFEPQDLKSIVKDIVEKATTGVDLSEAKVIVSGGRGVKSEDGFKTLQALADVLGAAVGASRGACDAGYCDYSLQIGQTGKVVTPDLYIACGISGAIQHLAGMSNSKVIVAINKDPEAPIFQIADYGIVADLFEVVPLLTEELKKVLA